MIERVARDPSIDISRLKELLAMKREMLDREAQLAFDSAFAEMQQHLPVIDERGEHAGTKSSYAKWEDIVEKISKMQNEQLPALVSAMKDEVGMEQANSFNDSTKQTLQGLLDAANSARDTLDNASRGIYGGEMDTGAAPDMGGADMGGAAPDMNAPLGGEEEAITPPRDGESELDAADTAVGGTAELGRGRRA
jgi:hypothetical protein